MAHPNSFSIHSYADAAKAMGDRSSLKLANNTYLLAGPMQSSVSIGKAFSPCGVTETAYYAVCLHNTSVVIYWANGDVTLNTGGWKTVTTRDRMRAFFPGVKSWPKNWQAKGFVRLSWGLNCQHGEWTVVLERTTHGPDSPDGLSGAYSSEVVKSYPLHNTLTLKKSRTLGGFALAKAPVQP
jgi:hypothetical protein